MTPVAVPFELLLPGTIFAAGGFYVAVRSAIRQLQDSVGRVQQHAAVNKYRIAIILLATCPPDQREKIANYLLQGSIGHEPI